MSKLPVSVLIPTYNRPYGLAEALESIARQTRLPAEIIIVNDAGSSVQDVVDAYADLPIQCILMSENRGHVQVRNTALSYATQPWIMPLDDDDYILPDHLENLWAHQDDADFIYSDAEVFDYRFDGCTRVPTSRRLFAYSLDYGLLRKFNTIVPSGTLYRKSMHDALGVFDEEVFNYWDWDWCLRVAAHGRFVRVPRATVIYAFATSGDNQSAQLSAKRNRYFRTFCEKHNLGELPVMNFFMMLEQAELKAHESTSERLWDGLPIYTRIRSGS